MQLRNLLRTVPLLMLFSSTAWAASPVPTGSECNVNLGVWLRCNNPPVIAYPQKLTAKDIGRCLKGLRLTDGTKVLVGQTYLGRVTAVPPGVHLYLFEKKKQKTAYLWVDKDAKPFPLPGCPSSVIGEGQYVLSGDVYTRKAAQPGAGVIEVQRPPSSWVPR